MTDYTRIHPSDNVCVALRDLKAGTEYIIDDKKTVLLSDIPMGHKFSVNHIGKGDSIIKYGYPIGTATAEILPGEHVHIHNIKTLLCGIQDYEYHPTDIPPTENRPKSFMGYKRLNGKVGIRNELWIVPTVGCVNDVVKQLEKDGQQFIGKGIDHVYAFPHPYGCSQMGDDQENTRKILADLVMHPNAGGVLLVGLGCENSGIDEILKYMTGYDRNRVRMMICQHVSDEHSEGLKLLRELADNMRGDHRTVCSSSQLVVGLKCGGSDGLSGITANPVIGHFSDELCSAGGAAILTEVPEMFGAETILMNRCENAEVFRKTVNLINSFKQYFESHHQTIYENPSPGNKQGGISTLEDKALGCTQKSGFSKVRDVLAYGEQITKNGLNLLYAPGNDLVASTALAASGAQIVLFSTGRGTPFACPVPTLKIATNTPLATVKSGWIDFNAGDILNGKTINELGTDLMEKVLRIASGEYVFSEKRGFHDLAILKTGVTL